jgi:hypothetical protein
MNDLLENLKVLLPLLTVVVVGAGFYYTTNHRLDHLEEMVNLIKANNEDLSLKLHSVESDLKKQKEDLARMRKTLGRKQDKRK